MLELCRIASLITPIFPLANMKQMMILDVFICDRFMEFSGSRFTQNCGSLYLEVSEGGGELRHVQSQAPGRASGAVDLLLNVILLR